METGVPAQETAKRSHKIKSFTFKCRSGQRRLCRGCNKYIHKVEEAMVVSKTNRNQIVSAVCYSHVKRWCIATTLQLDEDMEMSFISFQFDAEENEVVLAAQKSLRSLLSP
jgi:predicted Fe-S protein YdhL (DUF1289 family)